MEIQPEIVFRDMPRWKEVEEILREKAFGLERYFDKITSCRIVVEAPHLRRQKGQLYHIRIDITVPGKEIVVMRDPPEDHAREDVRVAIRDAFKAARRQLQDYARKRRGQTKRHHLPRADRE